MRHEFSKVFEQATVEMRSKAPPLAVRAEWLAGGLTLYLGLSQLLLWRFLGIAPAAGYGLGALLLAVLCWGVVRAVRNHKATQNPSIATLFFCLGASAVLFLLGGEGRLFYSNIDWQVRDAVLRDMAINSWPFVYTARGFPDVLRAPLGLYFVPALAFKAWGARAGDLAMLAQNSLLLGALLALASTLFATARQRLVALTVFVVFSGLDVLGGFATHHLNEHMEGWAWIQFSSTITLAFWVPQHAIAGWIGAVCYLLWRAGQRPLVLLLTLLPLTALWSPLAMIGSLPFAAVAGGSTLLRRELQVSDVVLPLIAVVLALPGLAYLSAADHAVGFSTVPISAHVYTLFESMEAVPYLAPLAYAAIRFRTDRLSFAVASLCLLITPLIRVGSSVDFTMRASIPALLVIAVLVAKLLLHKDLGIMKGWLVFALCVGAATGGSELLRAITHPASPRGACSFFKAWDQGFAHFPKTTYLAPLDKMPAALRPPAPAKVPATEPAQCWTGSWYRPRGV